MDQQLCGEGQEEGITMRHEKTFRAIEIFIILTVAMVAQVYTHVRAFVHNNCICKIKSKYLLFKCYFFLGH